MNTIKIQKDSPLVESNYVQYIDVLRVLSMLSVVFLHTASGSLRVNLNSNLWHFSNILTSIMSASVPIFFMVSGAMLLRQGKTASIPYSFKKRLPKAFIPFVVWSFVALAYYGVIEIYLNGNLHDTKSRLINIMSTPATIHLWFMYALIPLYLLSPILKTLVDAMSPKLFKYCLVLWFTFSSVFPTLAALVPVTIRPFFVLSKEFSLNFINGYIGYFLLGYYLLNYSNKVSIKLLSFVIVLDTAVISIGTWYKTMAQNQYSEVFKVYSRLFVLVLSVAIFLLVKEIVLKYPLRNFVANMVKILSGLSFGVYLMHNLLIDGLARTTIILPAYSISRTVLAYIIVLIICFVSIAVASSIKFTSYIFTGLTYNSACKSCNIQFLIKLLSKKK